MRKRDCCFAVGFMVGGFLWQGLDAHALDTYTECIMANLSRLDDAEAIAVLKESCQGKNLPLENIGADPLEVSEQIAEVKKDSALEERLKGERHASGNMFTIAPHKPNYLLFASYNSSPNGLGLSLDESEIDHAEMKFQLSFKTLLASNFIGDNNGFLYGAYTMKSFWQAYNNNVSSPFRETIHEPELFMAYRNDWQIFGWRNSYIIGGFAHQSNGRSNPLSRSWNRVYLDFIFSKDNMALSVKPWYRLPEREKIDPLDPGGDDNPDIDQYLGYSEITGAWHLGNHTLSFMLRNNLRSEDNRGAIELGWSFPLWLDTSLKGYVQYFNGYGESMVDYNSAVNRIGVGVMLADWL